MRKDGRVRTIAGKIFAGGMIAGIVLALAPLAQAADPPLRGKDLDEVVRVSSEEGPNMGKYVGRSFSDIGLFMKVRKAAKEIFLDLVGMDKALHPTYVDNIYLACPVSETNPFYKLAAAGSAQRGDNISMTGVIADVVGDKDESSASISIVKFKPGCTVTKRN
jgi:hypothetical protein